MNVGILTWHAAHNYGAMLQVFALTCRVNSWGHDVSVIDYCPASVRRGNRQIKWSWNPRTAAKNMMFLMRTPEWRKRYERFEQFKRRSLRLTEHYESSADLRRNPPAFDAYITGSDQVWNAEQGIDPVWLLDFVKAGRKVAYAPSFGAHTIDPRHHAVFQKYLPLFDALSCRERSGAELVRQMTGLNCEHVLDPTLLLSADEWGRVSVVSTIKQPYLLVYCLEESPEFMKLVPLVAGRTGLPVVVISGSAANRFKCSKVIRDAGPAEFVGLFQNAAMVCTNSFHGASFAVNFRKDFFSVPHTTRNSRLESLLNLVGLERRQLTRAEELCEWSDQDFKIDYEPVEPRLRAQIDFSTHYLKKALAQTGRAAE